MITRPADGGKGSIPRPFTDRPTYEDNFDAIFRKTPVARPEVPTDEPVVTPEDWDK